jgi:hypothetical protein
VLGGRPQKRAVCVAQVFRLCRSAKDRKHPSRRRVACPRVSVGMLTLTREHATRRLALSKRRAGSCLPNGLSGPAKSAGRSLPYVV